MTGPFLLLPEAVHELVTLSCRFPDVDIRLRIMNGKIDILIPTGPAGDEVAAAWASMVPFFEVRE